VKQAKPAKAARTVPPKAPQPAGPPTKAPAGRDRRGRLDAMPEVPSPKVALDAAVDQPGPDGRPASRPTAPAARGEVISPARPQPSSPPAAPTTESSWGARPEPPEGEPDREPRRLFRRRKP
jgi:hypothetical protein